MAISNLGLTQAEVDSIMKDITGGAAQPGTVLQPRTGQETTATPPVPQVRVTVPTGMTPPVKVNDGGSLLTPKPTAQKADPRFGPVIVGATTGLIFGGPPGALVGGAAMWLASKLIKPK